MRCDGRHSQHLSLYRPPCHDLGRSRCLESIAAIYALWRCSHDAFSFYLHYARPLCFSRESAIHYPLLTTPHDFTPSHIYRRTPFKKKHLLLTKRALALHAWSCRLYRLQLQRTHPHKGLTLHPLHTTRWGSLNLAQRKQTRIKKIKNH